MRNENRVLKIRLSKVPQRSLIHKLKKAITTQHTGKEIEEAYKTIDYVKRPSEDDHQVLLKVANSIKTVVQSGMKFKIFDPKYLLCWQRV